MRFWTVWRRGFCFGVGGGEEKEVEREKGEKEWIKWIRKRAKKKSMERRRSASSSFYPSLHPPLSDPINTPEP
jgi:hypothetical protein